MPRVRQPVNLNSHINQTVIRGSAADFAVTLKPVFTEDEDGRRLIPARRAIVRQDTGQAIAVVSDRYTLVPHTRILETVEDAIRPLDVGPVPKGIYVDRSGARLRAIFKFPSLAKAVLGQDEICPCLQVRNAYDGSSRILVHIGAFRFVCTNLAVGGGGVFAGGFVSIHAGEIPIERIAERLTDYLTRFEQIVELYRWWSEERLKADAIQAVLKLALQGRYADLHENVITSNPATVFDAYNRLTDHATHNMRSARTAFDLMERVNAAFQKTFPLRQPDEVIETRALAVA